MSQHTVSFITLGCAKNEVDTEHMSSRLRAAGYDVIDSYDGVDVIVVNTCSFIQAATEESIEVILDVAGLSSVERGSTHLVVAGCMPARYGDDLAAELPEVGRFLPCADEESIVSVIDELLGVERLPGNNQAVTIAQAKACISAYVKISDGCDRFCSYCTIPFIRGRYHSFSEDEIKSEVERYVNAGAREIVLIAQDTGRWGQDFETPSSLATLITHLAEQWSTTWFRVMYIQPEGITDSLIEAVATHDNVCSYFDIPFQHANNRILKAMNREGSTEDHLALIDRIRQRIPDVTLRTTLIAGYPGETEEDFDELCSFVEEAGLDYVGVFAYSREEGTRADKQDGHIDEDEKASRTQSLRDLADAVCTPVVSSRIGKEMPVLVCGYEEDGQLFGRAMCQAPDVDGVTYLDQGTPGDIVRVVIDDTLMYEMEGTVQ